MPEESEQNQTSTAEIPDLAGLLPARYEIRSIIGEGAMGVVVRAYDTLMHRETALKFISLKALANDVAKERFLRELKVLAALDHKNIVSVLSSGLCQNGTVYFEMELLEGHTLAKELEQNFRLIPSRFYEIFGQVMQALEHAHENKIIHRDIKPSNIMICPAPNGRSLVKLLDFGIASTSEGSSGESTLTASTAIIGTPSYMSPEQCTGAKPDQRSDIYSLGCVMYQCVTGSPPFEGKSPMDVMYKHVNQEAQPLESAADKTSNRLLARMIDRALAKDPDDRPDSVSEMIADLNKISSQETGSRWIFELKQASQASFPVSIAVSVLLLGLSACLVFMALEQAMSERLASKKELKKLIVKDKTKLRELAFENDQERALKRAEEQYKKAESPEEKSHALQSLLACLDQVVHIQARLKHYDKCQLTVQRQLSLIKDQMPVSPHLKARLLTDLAVYSGAAGDLKKSLVYYDQAQDWIDHSSSGEELVLTTYEILKEKTLTLAAQGKYQLAKNCLESSEKLRYENSIYFLRTKPATHVAYLEFVLKSMGENYASKEDAAGAIELADTICELLAAENPKNIDESISNLKTQVKLLKIDSSQARHAAERAYKIIAAQESSKGQIKSKL